jgi:endonuclease/exonuclease/phosphatase family metal-dependent hydrolase
MKLVSLNVYGGVQGKLLFDYIKEQAKNTDIFCLQEIFSAKEGAPEVSFGARMCLFEELQKILPEHVGIFEERSSGYDFNGRVDFGVRHGIAVFVKKDIEVISNNPVSMGYSVSGLAHLIEGLTKLQVLGLRFSDKPFFILNYHGPAQPGDKLDTEERISLSGQILEVVKSLLKEAPVILCGDFNLMPETESVKLFEKNLCNLIKDFKIQNTRNQISWQRFGNKQLFADYTFVSSEIKVKSFEVPYNHISDHLPMLLDFSI